MLLNLNHRIYSYMADITNELERTSRLSVLDGTDYISTMLGTFIGAPLFKFFGYYAVFGTSGSFALVGVIYATMVVKESIPGKSSEHKHITELQQNNHSAVDYGTYITPQNDDDVAVEENIIIPVTTHERDFSLSKKESGCSKNLPNVSDLFSSFGVIFRSRPGWKRALVLM